MPDAPLPPPPEAAAVAYIYSNVVRLEDVLLGTARRLVQDAQVHPETDGYFSAAVMVAGSSCEVSWNRGFDGLASAKMDGSVADAFTKTLKGSIHSDRKLQHLWRALSGVSVTQQPWWTEYKRHVARRDAVTHHGVHRGTLATREGAEASIQVAQGIADYVSAALGETPQ